MAFKINYNLLSPKNLNIKVWTDMVFQWVLIFCKIKCIVALVNIICHLFSVAFVKTMMSGRGQDFKKGLLKKAI